jgi:ABC-2 type transport system ATP-binding protein
MPDNDTALRAVGAGRRYGRLWALRDCTFTLSEGRVAALVGPNGAGKTTLLMLIAGLAEPSSGRIEVFGRPMSPNDPAALSAIGFMAQDHPLYRSFTVGELLRLGRALNPRWDQRLALDRLERLEIPLAARAGNLPGGQQAQVCLALALAKRPRLLVLDEPLASLDPLARRELLDTVAHTARAERLTVVFSSHVVAELQQVCDYLLVLAHGRLRLTAPIADLLAKQGRGDVEGLVLDQLRAQAEVVL